jgi:hypothetical protein
MSPLLLISIFYFLFVSFVSGLVGLQTTNSFLAYYIVQVRFLSNNRGVFFFGFLFVFLIFFMYDILKRREILKHFLIFIKQLVAVFITGSLITFLLLFIVAFVEINVLSIVTYVSPRLLGVESSSQVISEELKNWDRPPTIIAGEDNRNIIPITIAIASAGKESFYSGKIVSSFPAFLIFPAKKNDAGVLRVGYSLIVTKINSSDFQSVSSVVAYLMIKRYFPKQVIKSYPSVSLMTEDEYHAFRREDFNSKLKKFDEVITQIQKDSQDMSTFVDDLKNQISENETELVKASVQKEKEYTKCVNTGYYKEGIFVKSNTKEYCQGQVAGLDDKITEFKNKGKELSTSLQNTLSKEEQYKVFENYYTNQKSLAQEAGSYISYEFGTFEPPDTIKIALAIENNPQAVADYLELLVHEYLHYTRYEENGVKIGSAFFDEGLTEYFARRIIWESMGVDTNLGYPVNVKIITQITKRVAESDLAIVYFANDQANLENLLDRVYGKDFYKQNAVLFETLHYSSDSNQILKIGNDIMSEIGGAQMTERDINTSYSTFK